MEYWLFWQTKTMGSFQTAARLRLSWKSPRLDVPSPKLRTVTRSRPSYCAARAVPVATPRLVPRSPATQGTMLRSTGPVNPRERPRAVSYTHLRAHETPEHLV